MSFILGQYNKQVGADSDYMDYIPDGTADFKDTEGNSGVDGVSVTFTNECCTNLTLKKDTSYYFHGKIYKLDTSQTFYIKLIDRDKIGDEYIEQYIKTINVTEKDDTNNWVDVEFIFTPIQDGFNTLLFEMKRTSEDFGKVTQIGSKSYSGRKAYIGYIELSEINNVIPKMVNKSDIEFLKIGVQSRPGLLMCINNEGIRTSRSGIYELKEGVMKVYSFSVVNGSKEDGTGVQDWMDTIEDGSVILSKCFFNTTYYPKTRTIDNFTLDYIYEEKQGG